ncbi:MAG: APC family permease [Candidatus Acidiferrales bacterium]
MPHLPSSPSSQISDLKSQISDPSTGPAPALRRTLGLRQSTALVVGTIIGASIFVQPSEITGSVPSIPGILLVWLVSGILTLFGALVCAELASIFTRTGGVYIYLKECYSPALGFLWGWAMFWTMHSGIIAAIAVVFGRYAAYFLPLNDAGIKAVAILAILVLSLINFFGVRHGSAVQTWFTIGKLAAILFVVVAGWLLGSRLPDHFVPAASAAPVTPGGFFAALIAGLFAFGGWHMVTYNAEETHDPRRTIPRALLLGVLIVTACYIALNAVYLYVLPLDTVARSSRVAADAADALLGSGGAALMSALVIFSTFGALAGIILAGPRVYYAMAQDGLLFAAFARVHPRYRTPHLAIALQAVWSSLLVATGTYRALFTRVVFTEWIFFALVAAGLILLRRRAARGTGSQPVRDHSTVIPPSTAPPLSSLHPGYRIWGYPVVPIIFIAACAAIVVSHIRAQPADAAIGLALVFAGLPVYYFWARR